MTPERRPTEGLFWDWGLCCIFFLRGCRCGQILSGSAFEDRFVECQARPLDIVVKGFLSTNSSSSAQEQQAPASGRTPPAKAAAKAHESALIAGKVPPYKAYCGKFTGKAMEFGSPASMAFQDLALA
ncbi:MAG: hypothetical protein EBV16_07860 [Betaproteobacteria bacterium]|nr:hypothetical protein [Betaproteobacteria bacterium]NDA92730.1 hypothetical protein [Betaproteobacteria bacterium]